MTLWGANGAASSNAVKWAAESLGIASGHANIASNNTSLFQNTTPGAFPTGRNAGATAVGIFAASKTQLETANVSSEQARTSVPGWKIRRAGQGGLAAGITGANGVFTNGEFINVTGGSAAGKLAVVTNATGNLVSAFLVTPGLFPNTSVLSFIFERDQHLGSPGVAVTAPGGGYANTDTLVVGNGIVNAVYAITTNAAGNISSLTLNAAASGPGGAGLWGNAGTFGAQGNVKFLALAANGAASNGTLATFTANLQTSTGGGVNTASAVLGGRAGRVNYETLAVVKGIANGSSTLLPNT